ncbi:MAG: hypothetical protein GY869_00920, partial [Planctomycetes bacterium]|nr:hypothetical protein [Planctomycetota bacterium]
PEVGAGVWVEFEAGDLEFPIWVGTFWSKPGGESELPKSNMVDGAEQDNVQDPPTRKIIKTLRGHTIQFEDADGEEMIIIKEGTNEHVVTLDKDSIKITDGANDHVVTLDKDGIRITDGANDQVVIMDNDGIKVEDKNSNTITMNSDGITIESRAEMTLTGQNINIEA